jgi:hypothetical protein
LKEEVQNNFERVEVHVEDHLFLITKGEEVIFVIITSIFVIFVLKKILKK